MKLKLTILKISAEYGCCQQSVIQYSGPLSKSQNSKHTKI
jgi:hypothetical protein